MGLRFGEVCSLGLLRVERSPSEDLTDYNSGAETVELTQVEPGVM